MIVLIYAESYLNAERLVLRKNRRARISFLLRLVPVRLIAIKGDVQLAFLHLCLLQAKEVGVYRAEDVSEAFAVDRSQTVYVPRYKFHVVYLLK